MAFGPKLQGKTNGNGLSTAGGDAHDQGHLVEPGLRRLSAHVLGLHAAFRARVQAILGWREGFRAAFHLKSAPNVVLGIGI